jgi:adenylyltransferase/sulfurtransferase
MGAFEFSERALDIAALREPLEDPACGGFASFEGWVRDHNDGRSVARLEYEAYAELAVREGERIVAEAIARFGVRRARCVHRVGALALGELAVWVGVSSPHRAEAFAACRYIIDEVKHRVPIWKKEHYTDGDSGWVNCERCAAPGEAHADHDHAHAAVAPAVDYSRQTVLAEVGAAGQARLRKARVLVVGAGGLGAPVIAYLAGAGIGTLGIIDGDLVEPSNLHRQVLFSLADVGHPKALLAAARARAINPEVDARGHAERATRDNLAALAAGYDVLVDCSDNFPTRFLVNDVAVALGKSAVLASVYQYEGQLQVVTPAGVCLRCLWPEATAAGVVGNCAEAGVLGPVPGVLGSLQALEVLKLVLGLKSAARDAVVLIDLTTLETRRVGARRAPECTGSCVRLPDPAAPAEDVEVAVLELAAAVDEGFTVIDVRDAGERATLPAPAAHRHVPFDRLLDDPGQLERSGRYLILCARGQRSRVAATALRRAGIQNAWSVAGGMAGLGRSPAAR